jgi:membrane protease YdiL (CAAX protease family)
LIGFGPIAYEAVTGGIERILIAVGMNPYGGHGGTTTWRVLLERPELIIPALVVMFAIMAPLEEALYRGAVHHALNRFGVVGRVLVSGVLFGGMHLFLSGGLESMVLTTAGGFVFAVSYEWTRNLLVPIVIHATYWLMFAPI